MKYVIDIDSFIGDWNNNKKTVKSTLANYSGKPVNVRMNSLGGDVNHALDISAQFEEHGNVTVDLYSFNASSATIIALGAKHTRMHVDSLYLIHKVMSWVNEWGYMNEDDIQSVIDQLEKEKKENEKITLVLARKYAAKTGKSITDLLNLMKEETWLTAQTAKEWGFVDEVFGKHENTKVNASEIKNHFNAFGLPIPNLEQNTSEQPSKLDAFMAEMKANYIEFKNQILGSFSKEPNNNPQNPIINMRKEFVHINTLLNKEGIEEVDKQATLSIDEVQKINASLESAENLAREKDDRIAELEQEVINLKASPGANSNPVNTNTDNTGNGASNGTDDIVSAAVNARNLFDNLPD